MEMEKIRGLILKEIREEGISHPSEEEKNYLEKKGEKWFVKPKYREKFRIGLFSGTFDTLHYGHIMALKKAKEHCDILIVVVGREKPGRVLTHSIDERVEMVSSIKYVDLAIKGKEKREETIERVKPDLIIYGYDQPVLFPEYPFVKLQGFDEERLKTSKILCEIGGKMKIELVEIEFPKESNVIIGQSHFIKTVEDLYEAIVNASPSIKFGIAFCEASGKRLIRYDGNDDELIQYAIKNAEKIAAGHTFVIFIRNGFPINVLKNIKDCFEVVSIFAATANPIKVVVAEENEQRGILGVLDGMKPLGVEKEEDKKERKEFLRKIGYKR